MVIEEHIFYPRVRKIIGSIYEESFEEHAVARFELARLLQASGSSMKTRAIVLRDILEGHIDEEHEEMFPMVEAQVDLLLRGGPEALRAAKKLVRRMAQLGDRDVLAEETAQLLARLRVSPEGREGLSAFLERRKPGWQGE
jgi:enoyl-CoA hydratase/carnithine racemase